jgi:hypothetical protein
MIMDLGLARQGFSTHAAAAWRGKGLRRRLKQQKEKTAAPIMVQAFGNYRFRLRY